MSVSEDSLKIAVLIDFDNIEIGVKTTLNREFDVGAVLDAVKERGEVITKIAYGDWKRAGDYSRMLTQHAVRMVQRNMTPGGDKNGADINLALDALEMAFTHDHINAFVIVGGDSDFISLVEKLKQYDKKVFVVGGRQFTGAVMQKNCHEFIAYENLIRQPSRRQPSQGRERGGEKAAAPQGQLATIPVSKAIPLVTRALQVLTDREVTPQLGLLKSTLLQLDSTFSERDYGASSFRDFAEKLAETGVVVLRSAGRSVLVELKDTDGGHETGEAPAAEAESVASHVPHAAAAGGDENAQPAAHDETPPTSIIDGIRLLQHVLATPGAITRWPMYVRNVKQAMRAADPAFDERRHGNLVEILRSVQRDGLVRLDRDRQGVLRVFQGPQLRAPAAPVPEPVFDIADADAQAAALAPSEAAEPEGQAPSVDVASPVERETADEAAATATETPESGDAQPESPAAGATPRRRRKAGTAAPKSKPTTARTPRARTTTPRKKKDKDTETA
jgi:uncharacterized LabA/DUF88 family protein